ncbi:hypothetical protein [Butyrivibrio sp. YAB3001]|uniref:hypothetical protein n=1 Tax=Butyrivibrio sp. YAB3001 TaxID=1520812 RepID=UPI0008F6829B|nr:hypothetical protein [Butyrivibrio sp. YAB3001]SFB70148.1 hypothetical protein SAMN02910398_00324 [Butyrivibrio sp. YAB3001]
MSICVDRQEISLRTSEGFLSPSQCAPLKGFVPIAQAAEWYGDYGTYYADHSKGVAPTGDMAKLVIKNIILLDCNYVERNIYCCKILFHFL